MTLNRQFIYTIGQVLDLKAEQQRTLSTPALPANFILKVMFFTMDVIYGKKPNLLKCKVLEILARYPYWAWEYEGYQAITKRYIDDDYDDQRARHTQDHLHDIEQGREAQDNEQWHLMLIEDLMRQQGIKQAWVRAKLMPFIFVSVYFVLCHFLAKFFPHYLQAMNAKFESHAEREYMTMVALHPEWENQAVESVFFKFYPRQNSMADLFRRIALDERDHMNHSIEEYQRITGKIFVS